jgi:phage terminase large subunit GpA-like protein
MRRRSLSRGLTANPGRFKPFPFQLEPLDLITDERYNEMTLCWASQTLGKTELINCVIGWSIEEGPGAGMLMVLPTIQMAQSWSKLKLNPLLEDLARKTDDVTERFFRKGARAESTIQLKVWPEGFLVIGGANSAAALSMYTCRYLFFDEVDRYPASVATRGNAEGDPLTVTERRSETFSDSFSIHTSTPTTKGISRIEAELGESDYRKWHVRCLECQSPWVIMWADIKWPKSPQGEHLVQEAYLECPHCKSRLSDAQRREMVKKGQWIPTNPAVKDKPGYWANAFITLLAHKRRYRNRLHQWAAEFLAARRKGAEAMRAFVNQVLSESYEEPAEKPTAPEVLFNRREHYFEGENPILPEGVLLLTAGADKQLDRVELEVVGWGMGEESWSIDYRVFPGDFELKEFRETIQEFLLQSYETATGHSIAVVSACFDSGDRPQAVYKFVEECGPKGIWATKGLGSMTLPWINRSKSRPRLVDLHVDVAKATIYSRLGLLKPGPGYMHFPLAYDLEWFRQLVSERIVTYVRQGVAYKRFELWGGARNEALDCRVLAYAALGLLGRINWKALNEKLGGASSAPVSGRQAPDPALLKPEPGQADPFKALRRQVPGTGAPNPRQRPRRFGRPHW